MKNSVATEEIRNQKQEIESYIPCVFCKQDEPFKILQKSIEKTPFINDVLMYKKDQRPWLELLILDLRINKDEGLLPKSHTLDLSKLNNDTINLLINDFIELSRDVHFVFMTTEFDSASFRNYVKETKAKLKMESPPPAKKLLQGKNLNY